MRQGISIRQFAKLDHCDERLVRRALKNGWLRAYKDGSLNPKLAGTGWRRTNRKRVENVRAAAEESADDASVEAAADRLVRTRGLLTKAQAETVKENALAALRELQLAREVGSVVEVGAVMTEKARDHAIVRNLMLGLGSKLAPGLALMADPEQIKVAIDDEVDRSFEVLHQGGGDAD
jgi:hypothetical protein